MTEQQTAATDVVRRTITVNAKQEVAFQVFTEQFGSWWPRDYSIGAAAMADFVVEPRVGGRWYELGVDGTECDTGRVTAYEPPDRIVIAWHLDGEWHYDPDPAHASEFEVRFHAEDADRTRVELEHRYFERHGQGAPAVRGAVDSPNGWDHCLTAYATHVNA
jgi:uncharacterized protein YndB with AHSA1/START domain